MKNKIQLSYKDSALVGFDVLVEQAEKIKSYISYLGDFISTVNYEEKEASLNLVDAFDQPNVEAYKTETKKILESFK